MQFKVSIIALLLLMISFQEVRSQGKMIFFEGKIMDSKTKKPVPYVAINDKVFAKGQVADKFGEFKMETTLGSKLTFSSLGYKKTIVEVPYDIESDTIRLTIFMYKDTVTLKEIIIRAYPNRAQFGDVFVNKKIEKDQIQLAQDAIIKALKETPVEILTKKEDMPQGATIISISPSEVITRLVEKKKDTKNRLGSYKSFFDNMPDSIQLNNPHKTLEEIRKEMQPKKE